MPLNAFITPIAQNVIKSRSKINFFIFFILLSLYSLHGTMLSLFTIYESLANLLNGVSLKESE